MKQNHNERYIITTTGDLGKDVWYYVYDENTYNEYIGDCWDYADFKEEWSENSEFQCTEVDELIEYFITNNYTPRSAGVYMLY